MRPVVNSRNNPPESECDRDCQNQRFPEQYIFSLGETIRPNVTGDKESPANTQHCSGRACPNLARHEHRAQRTCGPGAGVYQGERPASIEPLEFWPKEAQRVQVEQQVDRTEVQEHWHNRTPILACQEVGPAGRSKGQQHVTISRTSRYGHQDENHRRHSEGRRCANGKAETLQFFNHCRFSNSSVSVPVGRAWRARRAPPSPECQGCIGQAYLGRCDGSPAKREQSR